MTTTTASISRNQVIDVLISRMRLSDSSDLRILASFLSQHCRTCELRCPGLVDCAFYGRYLDQHP